MESQSAVSQLGAEREEGTSAHQRLSNLSLSSIWMSECISERCVCHKYRKYHFIKIIYILIHFNERVDKSSIKALDLPRNLLPFPRTVRLKVVERKPLIENIVSVQCLIWGMFHQAQQTCVQAVDTWCEEIFRLSTHFRSFNYNPSFPHVPHSPTYSTPNRICPQGRGSLMAPSGGW